MPVAGPPVAGPPVASMTPVTPIADRGDKCDNKKTASKNQIDVKKKKTADSKPNGDLKQFFQSFGELSQDLVMRIHSAHDKLMQDIKLTGDLVHSGRIPPTMSETCRYLAKKHVATICCLVEKHELDAKDLLLGLRGVFERLNNKGEANTKKETNVYSVETSDEEVTVTGTKQQVTGKKRKFTKEENEEEEHGRTSVDWHKHLFVVITTS